MSGAANDARQLEALRALLLGMDHRELQQLAGLMNDSARRSDFLAEVVSEALAIRSHQDDSVAETLAPAIGATLQRSINDNPEAVANALYPVMGPAIRKSITETINSLFEGFNRALEESLSPRSLGWRVDAWRTGRSYSEVVMLKTLLYRVEQVFLIHKETGLLIGEVSASTGVSKDADMMSAMLTAIQDFVVDSFNVDSSDRLQTLKLGGLTILIEFGPDVVLAAAVRGSVPTGYVNTLVETLEKIQLQFRKPLAAFDGDSSIFNGLEPVLRQCLLQQAADSAPKKKPWLALLASAAVLIAAGVYLLFDYQDRSRWADFVEQLQQVPGVVVYQDDRQHKQLAALRDVNLVVDELSAQAFALGGSLNWRPFISMDDSLVLKRIHQGINLPASLRLDVRDGIVTLAGEVDRGWLREFRNNVATVAGVRLLNTDGLRVIDAANIRRQALLDRINSVTLQFETAIANVTVEQQQTLRALVADVRELQSLLEGSGQRVVITLTGSADPSGSQELNRQLSRQRAENARAVLQAHGLAAAIIRVEAAVANDVGSQPAESLRALRVSAAVVNPDE